MSRAEPQHLHQGWDPQALPGHGSSCWNPTKKTTTAAKHARFEFKIEGVMQGAAWTLASRGREAEG